MKSDLEKKHEQRKATRPDRYLPPPQRFALILRMMNTALENNDISALNDTKVEHIDHMPASDRETLNTVYNSYLFCMNNYSLFKDREND